MENKGLPQKAPGENLSGEKPRAKYVYLRRIKVQLMVITLLIAAFAPIAIADNGKYGIALTALVIAAGFAVMIWQDSANQVLVYRDRIVQHKGAGPWRRQAVIPLQEKAYLRDKTGLFTFGRRFFLQSGRDRTVKICIDSTLGEYQELLAMVVRSCPHLDVDRRAQGTLEKMGIAVSP